MGIWRSIRVKFVVANLLLILFSLELIGAYFVRTLNNNLIHNQTASAENQAQLMATIAAPLMSSGQSGVTSNGSPVLSSLANLAQGVVYLLNPEGVVLDTSVGSALVGQKRIDSAATQVIVQHRPAAFIRFDPLHQQHVLTVAVPITHNNQFVGIIEDVVSIEDTYRLLRQVSTIFYTGSLAVLGLSAILSVILSRTMSKPIVDVIKQTKNMAGGDFSQRVPINTDDEFGDLAFAVNDLTRRLEDAVQESVRERERLRAVIAYMGDGVVSFNEALQPTFYNEGAVKLVPEWKRKANQIAAILGISGAEDGGQTPSIVEQTYIRQLGETVLSIHLTPIRRRESIEGYVAVLRDVTEQEKLNRNQREFVANVSHELRTPLTSIKSYIEALQEGQDEDTQHKFLGVIAQETDRMVRLTRDLLQLSGLETVSSAMFEQTIVVNDWLHEVEERFLRQCQSRGIQFDVSGKIQATILGNRDMLDRVLDNIIGNAIHYTASGGKITVTAAKTQDWITVSVMDTGIGIPKEDLPHIYQRFYRVDKARSRRRGGSGLGLAIVKEIMDRHRGRLAIESEVGKGTTVLIALPVSTGGAS